MVTLLFLSAGSDSDKPRKRKPAKTKQLEKDETGRKRTKKD
jgi:hypothetical protein